MRAMNQPASSTVPASGARCAFHLQQPAVTICSRCGNYACEACLRVGSDRQDYCAQCAQQAQVLASLSSRFLANLVDQASIYLPVLIGGTIFFLFVSGSRGSSDTAVGVTFMLTLGATLGVIGYQIYLAARGRQSIGKRWLGIRVVRSDGSPVDGGRMLLLRNGLWLVLNIITGLSSLIDVLFIFSEQRRCLHDHVADTKVIEVTPSG